MPPKLSLKIDSSKDIDNAKFFIKTVKNDTFLDWFFSPKLQYINSGSFSNSEKNKIVTEYAKYAYKVDSKYIKEGVSDTEKRWSAVENKFYKLIDEVFQGHPWPKGNYTGYASIFRMYPRDIKGKSFFFPFSKKIQDPLGVIAHEMVHFIYFDYIKKKYGMSEETVLKGKSPDYIWRVSEAFNRMMENTKEYKKIFGFDKDKEEYKECADIYAKMREQWNKENDINKLLDMWLLKK
jgi:hypothetical protein